MPTAVRCLAISSCLVSAARAQQVPPPPVRSPHYTRVDFAAKDGRKLAYWLMKPANVEPETNYPLVLALHGRGGNTRAAAVLASDEPRRDHPCYVMAPAAATRNFRWAKPPSFPADPTGREDLLPTVLEALDDVIADNPVDPDRVYVTGQSMGGYGSFGAVAARPRFFAAAIPVCGGWDADDAKKFATVPLWAFHGSNDTTVPPERSRAVVEALRAAGGEPKYTVYEGVGHNSWDRAYESQETWTWLFAQKRKVEG